MDETLCKFYPRSKMSDNEQHWGLNAYGVAEELEVSLNERVDVVAWELELSYGAITIAAALDSPGEVTLLLAFMNDNYGKTKFHVAKEGEFPGRPAGTKRYFEVASMTIKTPGEVYIGVSKDGELPDRFHFSVSGKGFRFHADLHDPKTSKLISALRQVTEEMTNG